MERGSDSGELGHGGAAAAQPLLGNHRAARLATLLGVAVLTVLPAQLAWASPGAAAAPSALELRASGLAPVGPRAPEASSSAGISAASTIPGTRFSFDPGSLTAPERQSLTTAERRHGLPAGVPVPGWATKRGQHPYFAPSPRVFASGRQSRPERGARGAGAPPEGQAPKSGEGLTGPEQGGPGSLAGGSSREAAGGAYLGKRGIHEPPIRYLGGPVQHDPNLHVVFWGSNWNQEPGIATRKQLMHFYEGLAGSAEQGVLTQYFDPSARVTSNVTVDATTDTSVAAPVNVTGGMVEEEAEYAERTLGARGIESQYIVIPAPGTTYELAFAEGYCAFHDIDRAGGIYDFVPYEGDEPFKTGNLCEYYGRGNVADATNVMASHEYSESVTDPLWDSEPGWRSLEGAGGEVADLCATSGDELENGSYVQGWWDDYQDRCSESDPHPPEALAISEAATDITNTTATLNGSINPESASTSYYFEYGSTTSYGSRVPANESEDPNVGAGRSNVSVDQAISGLQLENTVHYRLVAKNVTGTTYGEDRTVTPSHWKIETPTRPASFGENWFNGVSCAGAGFCAAVGYFYDESNSPANQALSYVQNGHTWTQEQVPATVEESYPSLTSVSCPAHGTCTAVGEVYEPGLLPLVDRFSGEKWTREEVPATGKAESWLGGVSCVSTSECMAVGGQGHVRNVEEEPYALSWKGGKWSAVTIPAPANTVVAYLERVSCTSSTFCAAVGVDWTATSNIRPFTDIWDGSKWTLVSAARQEGTGYEEEGTIFGVSCTSATFCVAVGRFHYRPYVESWNGTAWSTGTPAELVDSGGGYLAGVSCTSPTACTAVGGGWSEAPESGEPGLTLEESFNGSSWTEEKTSRENERANNEFASVSCVAEISCTAVGFAKFGDDKDLIETRTEPISPPSYTSSFGTAGAGAGQLNAPNGTAVDSAGNVWVSDSGNARVDEFSASGTFLKAFGWGVANGNAEAQTCTSSCRAGLAGSGAGQLDAASDVAVAQGHVWVVDNAVKRVDEFSSAGAYERAITTSSRPVAIAVDSAGNLWTSSEGFGIVEEFSATSGERLQSFYAAYEGISGLAVDAQGNVWVATNHARIDEYSSSGTLEMTFGWGVLNGQEALQTCTKECRAGIAGAANGQLEYYERLFIYNGELWVADNENDRVQVFTLSGEYLTQFGSAGSGAGQFRWPSGMSAGGGTLYVTDTGNDRVEAWAAPSAPSVETRAASAVAATTATLNAAVNPNGAEVSECFFEYGTSVAYGQSAPCATAPGSGSAPVEVSAALTGLHGNTTFHFRIVARNKGGITDDSDQTFKTLPVAPSVETKAASSITAIGATLNASVNPNGTEVSACRFEYGTSVSYGQSIACTPAPGSGESAVEVSAVLAHLSPHTTYHFRISATNSVGTSYGTDAAFIATFNPRYTSSFGTAGAGAGQLNAPNGTAVDSAANVWVSDSGNARVDEFSASGTFLKAFGWGVANGNAEAQTCTSSCRAGLAGSGAGQLDAASDVAVAQGHVWVVDNAVKRVDEFSSAGAYERAITTSSRPVAIAVDSAGNLWTSSEGFGIVEEFSATSGERLQSFYAAYEGISGLAVDAQGNVWVATNHARIDEYSSSGTLEMTFGWGVKDGKAQAETCTSECQAGIAGAGNGQLDQYGGRLLIDEGELWVADTENDRVQVFTLGGEYLTQFGSAGSGAGQFLRPNGMAAAAGLVYVADTGNDRVEKWTAPIFAKVETKPASSVTATTATLNASVNPDGAEVSSCLLEYGTTTAYGKSAPCTPSPGSGESPVAVSAAITGLSANTTYHFRVVATNTGGTSDGSDETLKTLPGAPSVETKAATLVFQTAATLNASVNPNGVTVSKCEFEYGTTTSYGKTAACASLPGSGTSPVAVSARVSGLTANTTYHFRISATNSQTTSKGADETLKTLTAPSFTSSFGSSGAGAGQVKTPAGVALDAKGNAWIADSANNRIDEFSATGTFVKAFGWGVSNGKSEAQTCTSSCKAGLAGTGNGEFKKPWGVAFASSGEILVTEAENNRVQEFSAEGKYVRQFGSKGTGNGQFSEPTGITVSAGNIWVADTANNRVQEFNSEGKFTTAVGSLSHPQGLAVDASGDVWVVDSTNARVEELSSSGTFLQTFGWGVSNGKSELQSCTSGCKAGIAGSGSGQFKEPTGIAVDSKGELWVVDGANSRVQEFTPAGEFIVSFGSAGSGSGQFSKPWGIGVAGSSAYVADGGNNRVQRWAVAE